MIRRTATVALLLGPAVAFAVPTTMRHQARILDSSGEPINDTLNLTFKLHVDDSTSAWEWTEEHPGVVVADGYYSVELGRTLDLDPSVFDGGSLWLSTSDTGGEIIPRAEIHAVPYATHAGVADRVYGSTLPAFFVQANSSPTHGTGWHLATWSETEPEAFDNGGNFASNVFTAPVAGLYFFTASIRYDNTSGAYMRVLISKEGSEDYNNMPHVIDGGPSSNYQSMTTSGLLKLAKDDTVGVKMYSAGDTSWQAHSESSFSGYLVAEL